MQQIIEQLSKDTGIKVEEVKSIFTAISGRLVNKVPALQQVIDDVFQNAEIEILKEHISKLIIHLQQEQCKEKYMGWNIPQCNEAIHGQASNELF